MLIMSISTLVGGGISYIVFSKLYKRRKKRETIDKGLYLKTPIIIGVINLVMALLFGFWFVSSPDVFSADQEIVWNIGTVIFTVFTVYFYILAIPVSIGEMVKTYLLHRDGYIGKGFYLTSLICNGVASLILFFLIIAILG